VTVLVPAASRTAAPVTGLDSEELDEDVEVPDESLADDDDDELGFGLEGVEKREESGLPADDELGLTELDELEASLPFSCSVPLSLLLSFSFSLSLLLSVSLPFSSSFSFIACNFAIFSFSASLGLEDADELELDSFSPLPIDTAADAEGEADAPAPGGSGWVLSSCETSWSEKNSRRRKPRFLLTATYQWDLQHGKGD